MAKALVRVPGVALVFGALSLSAMAGLERRDDLSDALAGEAEAVEALRAQEEAGLERVMAAYATQSTPETEAEWSALIDAVAGQRDAVYGGLYWHTDLDAAKARAAETGRPILSLRLLGALTDEYSCANSRFFRTVLYTHPELAGLLKERFVLHWSTERPVPLVTIDFGDGRQMKRTLTGNSAHYILDAQGRPLDVLPGMFGADTFHAELTEAEALHRSLLGMDDTERAAYLAGWHMGELERTTAQLVEALGDARSADEVQAWLSGGSIGGDGPVVRQAMNLSMSKMIVETPILEEVVPDLEGLKRGSVEPTDDEWSRIAEDYRVPLHDEARSLISEHQPVPFATIDSADPGPLFARFEQSVAEDTARNALSLHPRIHSWFAGGEVDSFEALNRRVYDELFATPAADPWMGLLETDVYTGLQDAGLSLAGD